MSGLSKFHLDRSFRNCLGVPLHCYVITIRLAHAKELLKRGWRLAEVAASTGFCDAPHLSRTFAAELGIKPSAYAMTDRARRSEVRG